MKSISKVLYSRVALMGYRVSVPAIAISLLTFNTAAQVPTAQTTATPPAPATLVSQTPYTEVNRDANSRMLQSVTAYTDAQGKVFTGPNTTRTGDRHVLS